MLRAGSSEFSLLELSLWETGRLVYGFIRVLRGSTLLLKTFTDQSSSSRIKSYKFKAEAFNVLEMSKL